jgi:hypothetical protein
VACKAIEHASPNPTVGRRPGVPEMRQHADERDWQIRPPADVVRPLRCLRIHHDRRHALSIDRGTDGAIT